MCQQLEVVCVHALVPLPATICIAKSTSHCKGTCLHSDNLYVSFLNLQSPKESASTYELVEVSTGGKLSRHNIHVQQLGPDTGTELTTFHLSVSDQTQDLHNRLVMDHPRVYSRQLHKIVAHSLGQVVFYGNVKVNRLHNRLMQDIKCSLGVAISDLEESQLFYFRPRGVDLEMAKKALIFACQTKVIKQLHYPFVK